MKQNVIVKNGISLQSITDIKNSITTESIDKAFHNRLDRWSMVARTAIVWLQENDEMDEHLVDIMNKLKGEKNLSGAMNSMAIRMTLKRDFINAILKRHPSLYAVEYAKLVIAGTLIDAAGFMGILPVEVKDGTFKNPINGRIERYSSNWYLFQDQVKTMFDEDTGLPEGLNATPGELGGRKLNLHPWESDIKFNGDQKQFLRDCASVGYKLIVKPRDWWVKYFKESKWYIESLKRSNTPGGESRSSLKSRVQELVDGIMRLYEYDVLYFSYTFQISGRLQAILSVEGIAPQGSGKTVWEFSNGRKTNRKMVKSARIDSTKMWAKTHHKGVAINTSTAESLWKRNRSDILEWLIGDHGKMKDSIYLEGLHEILTVKLGTITHRQVGRDLTTNGLAVFSSNYRMEKPALVTNIGGSDVVGDVHTELAEFFGITREEGKKTGINAGLLHGQNAKNISKQSGIPYRDLVSSLNGMFGKCWTYFNRIASHIGQNLITNMNTSTRMRSPEGWYFINQAYVQKSQVRVTIFSHETDSGIREIDVIRDMPILFNGKKIGNIIFKDPNGKKSLDGVVKMSGAYANSIHMLDSWMLRTVIRKLNAPLHHVHDNFFTFGDELDEISSILIGCHIEMYKYNYLQRNVNYMIDQSRVNLQHIELDTGDLLVSSIMASHEFMQP